MLETTFNTAFIASASTAEEEAKYLKALESDGPIKDKFDACRMLARLGSKKSIKPLAKLLDDEKLAHMARYGLEPNPDPGVDEVFRSALGRLKGLHLVGVIGSIGVRRDAEAVEGLVKHLNSDDDQVAEAAARALGSIGTIPAGKQLARAVGEVPQSRKLAFCEGLLRCAEHLAKENRLRAVRAIYRRLNQLDNAPEHVKKAAQLGMAQSGGQGSREGGDQRRRER